MKKGSQLDCVAKHEVIAVLRFYADAENYEEKEYRTPHCHSWWETPLIQEDKGKRAKEILEKYFNKEL